MNGMNETSWECCGQEFRQEEVYTHLQTVHGLKPPIEGRREMVSHVDAPTWYQSYYRWTIGELVLGQVVRRERAQDDPMRMEHEPD